MTGSQEYRNIKNYNYITINYEYLKKYRIIFIPSVHLAVVCIPPRRYVNKFKIYVVLHTENREGTFGTNEQ